MQVKMKAAVLATVLAGGALILMLTAASSNISEFEAQIVQCIQDAGIDPDQVIIEGHNVSGPPEATKAIDNCGKFEE